MANFFPTKELPAKPDTAIVADAAAIANHSHTVARLGARDELLHGIAMRTEEWRWLMRRRRVQMSCGRTTPATLPAKIRATPRGQRSVARKGSLPMGWEGAG